MSAASAARLLLLGFSWGIGFLFINLAAPSFGPILLVALRVAIGGLVLLAYARSLGLAVHWRANWRLFLALGALNSSIPFVLVAYGQLRVEASLAAILICIAPMFSAVLAHIAGEERIGLRRLAGLVAGVAGVAILLGWAPPDTVTEGFPPRAVAIALILAAALVYSFAAVYSRDTGKRAPGLILAGGSQIGGAVLLLPLLPAFWPTAMPTLEATASMIALALVCSALAFVLYFRLIADIGPVKTLTVNFIAPVFGVGSGVAILGEAFTPSMMAGAAVILVGTWLVLDPLRRS